MAKHCKSKKLTTNQGFSEEAHWLDDNTPEIRRTTLMTRQVEDEILTELIENENVPSTLANLLAGANDSDRTEVLVRLSQRLMMAHTLVSWACIPSHS